MTAAQEYWWLAPVLSAIAIVIVLWFQWGQYKVRNWRMRYPFKAFLTAAHDGNQVHVLRIPPHQDVLIQLLIYPRLHYTQTELLFGFRGDQNAKPTPVKVVNTFIKVGKQREQSPDDNEDHYIDINDNYHIRRVSERTKPNCYAIGFLVKTKTSGKYPIRLEAITDSGESLPARELTVIVEEHADVRGATPEIRS